jgi:hypothetical protein
MRVIQDIKVTTEQLRAFPGWFSEHLVVRPAQLGRLRAWRDSSSYRLRRAVSYISVGFRGTVYEQAVAPR